MPRLLVLCCWAAACGWAAAAEDPGDKADGEIRIAHLAPDPRGGRAYLLDYVVAVPIDVHWRFKTDFDNDFLVQNRFIRSHRLVMRDADTVITETQYTDAPDALFRWRTVVNAQTRRLTFELLNPEQIGQRFHYGHITLAPSAHGTRVTQVAYFDFWGAAFWAGYPWRGGMREFLTYTARWEQETILKLRDRYEGSAP
ncbi:MAG: hypothetical protein KFF50_04240 [Desulfatitalea sp.]|nr:hypothetical protein [Desulfatitalea sp.]